MSESATMAMALRVWPKEALTAKQAPTRLRQSFLTAVKTYMGTDVTASGYCECGLSPIPAVRWIHTNMERSFLPTGQYDLTCVCFVFHELPQEATRNIIAELYLISNSGGVVAITDNNPMSAVIQPALFTLMKATEPWSDQYYVFDLEAALKDAGFVDVKMVETDPRHRTVLARKPATDPDSQ
eukprot:gene35721-46343_t